MEGVIPKARAFSSGPRDLARGAYADVHSSQTWVKQPAHTDTMRKPKRFYVYIMTNSPRSHTVYTGVTGNLPRRVFEHKNKLLPGFTSRYNLTRLVYYESFAFPDVAIDREKEIKGWRRSKKIRLIDSMNPHWYDLAKRLTEPCKPETRNTPRQIPRPAGESAGLRDDVIARG